MWPFEPRTARRKEIRRSRAERGLTFGQKLRESLRPLAIAIAAVSGLATALILNAGDDPLDVRVGESTARAITARVAFSIEDVQQTQLLRGQAREAAPNFYRLDTGLIDDLRGRLLNLLLLARTHAEDAARLRTAAAEAGFMLDEAAIGELLRLAGDPAPQRFERQVDGALELLSDQPLVDDAEAARRRTTIEARLDNPLRRRERTLPRTQLILNHAEQPNRADALAVTRRVVEPVVAAFDPPLRAALRESLAALLLDEPNEGVAKPLYRYDPARTQQLMQQAYERVETQYLNYPVNTVLADAGVITPQELALIAAETEAFRRQAETDRAVRALRDWPFWGRTALGVMVSVGVVGFFYRFGPRAGNPVRQVIIAGVLLALLGLCRAVVVLAPGVPETFAVGVQALAAGLLGIVYSRVLIFGLCGGLAVLITMAVHQDVSFLVTLLAVAGILVLGVRTVRNRGKIVGVGLGAGLVAFATTIAGGLVAGQARGFILNDALWAGGTTLAAAFLLEGLLPWIEKIFGVTTDMTLLECCDASKPLLRMLAAEAPGTYNHSLLVGALAEAAAEAIGAHGLLARAGAYYHDIGKINKPEYFAENQNRYSSRHARLSPQMSVLIIVGHVKNGIEMAREYRLPPSLHAFIAEHHGTTVVEYFYHAASKARKPGEPEPPDTEFRYPGPRPQSRETAILMLCDGVEGAVRAMAEPTPARIEAVVSEIARKRLLDGQFDECDLTFRDLAAIERSIVKSLCGIYHARVAYPSAERERSRAGADAGERSRTGTEMSERSRTGSEGTQAG